MFTKKFIHLILFISVLSLAFLYNDFGDNLIPEAKASQSNWAPKAVFAHYYPWFKNPTFSGAYAQWNDYGHTPPNDISSASYPILGAYDSTQTDIQGTLWWHMTWMVQAKVDVVLVSWWGIGSPKNGNTQAILDYANTFGLKVAFMIDTYPGRTSTSTVNDVSHIYQNYGSHPAFYKVSRSTQYGPTTAQRGVFFVYGLDLGSDPNWPNAIDSIHNNPSINSIIIAEGAPSSNLMNSTWVQNHVDSTHADGVFNYAIVNRFDTYTTAFPESNNWILIPAVAPGFDSTRAHGLGATVLRNQGAFYDSSWWAIADKKPEWTSVVSFNEWHETTQIEPVTPFSIPGFTYLDYNNHYGYAPGVDANTAYLNRNAYWVNRYKDVYLATGDQDADGTYNAVEEWLTTNPERKCPITTTINDEEIDSWMPDLNDDRKVNTKDRNIINAGMGYSCGNPNFKVRYDLNPDCVINSADRDVLNLYFNQTCTP